MMKSLTFWRNKGRLLNRNQHDGYAAAECSLHHKERLLNRNRRTILVTGALCLAVLAAQAVPLVPGGVAFLFGTTVAARPELACVVIRDAVSPFEVRDANGNVVLKGTIQDRVVKENATGTLDFYFRIKNDPGSTAQITRVDRRNYAAFATDVDYRTDGLGEIGPTRAWRSNDGSAVYFDFSNAPILPGQSSRFVFIRTPARNYNLGGFTVLNGRLGALALTRVIPSAQPQ
jgi:hypothetical protein